MTLTDRRTPEARVSSRSKRRIPESGARRFHFVSSSARGLGSPPARAAAVLVAAGAALRLWQYLANNSLWIDEAALARNIIDLPLPLLFGALDYAQVAPVGFLLVERGLVTLFGSSEYVLRAFPLACGLVALPLFWRVAWHVLSGWAATYAVGLFALGIPFVYFSSQVKQYSSDVAVAVLLLLAAIEIRACGVTARRALSLGVIGATAVWLSQPAVFVLAGVGAALLILVARDRDRAAARLLAITWTLWAAGGASAVLLAVRTVTADDRAYLRWFWADGFMPIPHRAADLLWLFDRLTWAFGSFGTGPGRLNGGLNYRWSWVFTLVLLVGIWSLWKRHRDVALFVVLPLAVLVVLSATGAYPFAARLSVFLLPSLLLATAAGAQHVFSIWPARLGFLSPVGLAILGGAPLYAAATALPPSRLEHLRPILEHVQARREPTDAIYVYYGAGQAFRYYSNRLDLSTDRVVMGRCIAGGPVGQLRQLDQLRGLTRVWVIVTHSRVYGQGREGAMIMDYLDRIGRRLETAERSATSGQPAEAAYGLLFDLSAPARLASASAEDDWAGPDPPAATPSRFGCHGTALPDSGRLTRR